MKKSGLFLHASTAAFAPARALTSHVRKRYRERYSGRYRMSRAVFIFDAVFAIAAVAAIVADLYFAVTAPRRLPDVGLYFSAPPVVTAKPIAFEATVVSQGEARRKGMRLAWDLPPGTEMLSSMPPLDTNGEAYIGDVEPKKSQTARIVVRVFSEAPSVRLGFRIRNKEGYEAGSQIRPVVGSGLALEAMAKPDALVSGASVPYRVKNETAMPIEQVSLRTNGKVIAGYATLPAFAEQVVLVPSAASPLRVEASSRGMILARDALAFTEGEPVPVTFASVPSYRQGKPAFLEYAAEKPVRIMVYHPGLRDAADGVRMFDVPAGRLRLELPLDPAYAKPVHTWFVIPMTRETGLLTLGTARKGIVTSPFSATAQVRYYAASGDQIGVGPLPPRSGQATKYWVNWKLGATSEDVSGVEFRARLPESVTFSGRYALPDGGALTEKDGEVTWTIPFLAAQNQGVSAAFEIAFTPTARMKGRPAALLEKGFAKATENRTGIVLDETLPELTTELFGDEKAAGKWNVK